MSKEESKRDSSDDEDIPSDFFDEFCKEDFMQVIDCWHDETKDAHIPIDEDAVNSVSDLRELIVNVGSQDSPNNRVAHESPTNQGSNHHENEEKRLNYYIQPGSRRDPKKTKQAIKKDKEVKVKELLAKHLESMDDIRPPGTELDDYFDESRNSEKKKFVEEVTRKHMNEKEIQPSTSPIRETEKPRRTTSTRIRRESPSRKRRVSPSRYRRESPVKYRRSSPNYRRHSPPRIRHEHSPPRIRHEHSLKIRVSRAHQKEGRGHIRFSPTYSRRTNVSHRSPKIYRSPDSRRERRSRSPYKRYKSPSNQHSSRQKISNDREDEYIQSKSQSVKSYGDPFQYPQETFAHSEPYYAPKAVLQPVPAPVNSVPGLSMVPAPYLAPSSCLQGQDTSLATQSDALAKLVADGKLSHEDYLKLAPTKGSTTNVEPTERVAVLNRCRIAMESLCKLGLPHQLVMSNVVCQERKAIAPQFCSPLKRETAVEFQFSTNNKSSLEKRNKEIIDSIISSLSLEKIISRPKKKTRKDMRDASVQTTLPVCDVCDIRESTKFSDISTSIDPDHFSSAVHTQVIEADLYSSKSLFNPSGSSSSREPISIAHLTPAQLVSRLAARAKTLKHMDTQPSNPSGIFENYQKGGNPYHNSNYNNYRY